MNTPTELRSNLLPDDEAFTRMKRDLFERIDADELAPPIRHAAPLTYTHHPAKKTIRRRWAGAMAVAAAAITVALLGANLFSPNVAPATAAEVLRSAAAATIITADPVVGPGQYLMTQRTEGALGLGEDFGYVDNRRSALYIPYDRSSTWIEETQWLPAGEIFGDSTKAQAEIDSFGSTPGHGDAKYFEGPAGIFAGYDESHPELASMPTDPTELLDFVYTNPAGGNPPDEQAFQDICDHLSTGVVPAKLRAAMYEALAEIPGVYVAEDQATLDGRTGVAIGRKLHADSYSYQLIIDPATGLIIGTRTVQLAEGDFIPAGITGTVTLETTVVDQAPTGPFTVRPPQG
ncbi:CU044_5270 family protein [Cryobacterium sp. SO2]|uniref:CU044_5270 family protein n=1 Tax=Cryobacterium sp. SO2 TaxID=1897060 RepID=UPI00223E22F3|nr:CU044_5270 family protein [Cryobacterium sp. SO2]WEO77235.1 CU044_5270 family protein [Cryobacterium sp. SO2]